MTVTSRAAGVEGNRQVWIYRSDDSAGSGLDANVERDGVDVAALLDLELEHALAVLEDAVV